MYRKTISHGATTMEHTYLRYECADTFGLAVASASSKAPVSHQILAFVEDYTDGIGLSQKTPPPLLLSTAGSCLAGYHLRSALQPVLKIGHAPQGGVGTGRALNDDEVVCVDVCAGAVATGWVDGAVRVFALPATATSSTANSLLDHDGSLPLWQSDPLLLNGHSGSPVRTVAFDPRTQSRLASGGSDGTVVLWDIVAETGLYRLLGHRGGVTAVAFAYCDASMDCLISCSLDGLVKVWDLQAQCCVQTMASHRGEVLAGACRPIVQSDDGDAGRWRLITGGSDGQVRVWSVQAPSNAATNENGVVAMVPDDSVDGAAVTGPAAFKGTVANPDDVCRFMGSLTPPPNVAASTDKVAGIHYHTSGRFVGVLHDGRNVDLYLVRGTPEAHKRRSRRLRRRQEKSKKKTDAGNTQRKNNKRGLLDDVESSDDDDDEGVAVVDATDPELVKASDEFEYLATVRAGHKVRGFRFCTKEKNEVCRIVCALATNAFETHAVIRKQQGCVWNPIGCFALPHVLVVSNHAYYYFFASLQGSKSAHCHRGEDRYDRFLRTSDRNTLDCHFVRRSIGVYSIQKRDKDLERGVPIVHPVTQSGGQDVQGELRAVLGVFAGQYSRGSRNPRGTLIAD